MIVDLMTIVFELCIQEHRSDKHPRADLSRYQIRVLADPAETGACRPRLVHEWSRVDADLCVQLRMRVAYPVDEFSELLAQNIVVIITPGITPYIAVRVQ